MAITEVGGTCRDTFGALVCLAREGSGPCRGPPTNSQSIVVVRRMSVCACRSCGRGQGGPRGPVIRGGCDAALFGQGGWNSNRPAGSVWHKKGKTADDRCCSLLDCRLTVVCSNAHYMLLRGCTTIAERGRAKEERRSAAGGRRPCAGLRGAGWL
ncbi:hypothetical protein LZ30DRAFT_705967 [Colletotrichum cereale]|nr:hypothetical protein LZ30DRAFT_705967 [Colletotrichum cereale]